MAGKPDNNMPGKADDSMAGKVDDNLAEKADDSMAGKVDDNLAEKADDGVAGDMAKKADDNIAAKVEHNITGKADNNMTGKAGDNTAIKTGDNMAGKRHDNLVGKEFENMNGEADEDFSCLICTTLDTFGFDRESISSRSKFCINAPNSAIDNSCRNEGVIVFAGSLAEGVGLRDSDIDTMCVLTDVLCVDEGSETSHFNILEADYATSSPGYTKIVPAYLDNDSNSYAVLNASYMYGSRTGRPYISSIVFRNYFYQIAELLAFGRYAGMQNGDITNNGPAVTRKIFTAGEQDVVFCLYFYGGDYSSRWANRARFNSWPSADLVREVSQMEGYIVPVGDKISDTQNIEWRICYTTAEKKLVSSLNDVQMKLYVLLKLIAKKILKPVCKEITSYVVKNVVFWMAEMTSAEQFSPERLVTLVLKSLYFIKHCLQNNHFPNYMIPERNLLSTLHGEDKMRTIRFISECLKDGVGVVLRVPELRKCVYFTRTCPKREVYRKWRNEAEKLVHEIMSQLQEHFDANLMCRSSFIYDLEWECFKNERYFGPRIGLLNILVPEWPDFLFTGKIREFIDLACLRLKALWVL